MSDPELLARIAERPELFRYFEWPCDFDVTRLDPVEPGLSLRSGATLVPVAGCGAGGSYFLVDGTAVLYASSEGECALIADSLRAALELMAGVPFWKEYLHLSARGRARPVAEVLAELDEELAELPEFAASGGQSAARALGLGRPDRVALLTGLRDAMARTSPGHLLINADGEPYDEF
ncbi:hypothetical protein ACWD33_07105 [Streptomyces xiamenensis]|uniref:Uncharacterized protein n=1 Tax=Streptomyces xiamenensis TaxID=408015 RepID=A0A0F7FT12_9ACTN|nr:MULTISPECIES: hypothetical protein [Streptomyces]AKG42815.1 hypothetical protein SXIM_14310 [Streptomyces xiamenensis]